MPTLYADPQEFGPREAEADWYAVEPRFPDPESTTPEERLQWRQDGSLIDNEHRLVRDDDQLIYSIGTLLDGVDRSSTFEVSNPVLLSIGLAVPAWLGYIASEKRPMDEGSRAYSRIYSPDGLLERDHSLAFWHPEKTNSEVVQDKLVAIFKEGTLEEPFEESATYHNWSSAGLRGIARFCQAVNGVPTIASRDAAHTVHITPQSSTYRKLDAELTGTVLSIRWREPN